MACEGSDDDTAAPQCIPYDATACTPQFPAQFDRLHAELLLPVCGVQGGACHANTDAEGAAGGLIIVADLDETYATLLDADAAFVRPEDVACSPLLARVNTSEPEVLMPPGTTPLADGLRCALAQWVEAGAPR